MENRLIIAGFGGQGVMLTGQLLSCANMEKGLEAIFLPHYGPEQRGGTASCRVTLSDREIFSPVVREIDVLMAFNDPSLAKFESQVRPGGMVLTNSSLCKRPVSRADVSVHAIPADAIAEEIGSQKVANIVVLGAYIALTGILTQEEVFATIRHKLARKPELFGMNREALRRGAQAICAPGRAPRNEAETEQKERVFP